MKKFLSEKGTTIELLVYFELFRLRGRVIGFHFLAGAKGSGRIETVPPRPLAVRNRASGLSTPPGPA
jgi:hypothetical protein